MSSSPLKTSHADHHRLVDHVRSVPLAAAIVAPLITLLDIPALTQRWYLVNGEPAADPKASIAMSALSLLFCVVGNALLVARFSSDVASVRALVVEAPLVAFWIKTIIEVVNLSIFGRKSGQPGPSGALLVYGEGFWCAVFSCGLSGVVAALLLLHFVIQGRRMWKDSISVRIDGRHFILSVSCFVAVVGLQALVFSKIEGWFYWDGVYFSIVSCLTVGFGDLQPERTSSKILLFPFVVLAIAMLANQVSMIVGYFGHQSELTRSRIRAQRLLLARQRRAVSGEAQQWGLQEEMAYLTKVQQKERHASDMYNLVISLTGFVSFWVIGAAVFKVAESWTMGTALYFTYISFLTIGYGTPAPESNLGRVFFVLFSLIAIPVVASFAVQTITTIIKQVSDSRLSANRLAREEHIVKRGHDFEAESATSTGKDDEQHPHAHFILDNWAKLQRDGEEHAEASAEDRRESQTALADRALELACLLESQARSMLISTLPKGSKAQTLLRADRNVQRRDIKALEGSGEDLNNLWEEEDDFAGASEEDLLRSIRKYRETFAKFLVVGARMRQLEGANRRAFLRIREEAEEASFSSSRAQREMEEMNEADGDLEVVTDDQQLRVSVDEKGL